jgi:hypothetical protein
MTMEAGAGFKTTVLPQAKAGAIFHAGIATGKFQGVMRAHTPKGYLRVMSQSLERLAGYVSPSGACTV